MIWINCGAGELCSTHTRTRLEFPLCPSAACDPDFLECSLQLFSRLSRHGADLSPGSDGMMGQERQTQLAAEG